MWPIQSRFFCFTSGKSLEQIPVTISRDAAESCSALNRLLHRAYLSFAKIRAVSRINSLRDFLR